MRNVLILVALALVAVGCSGDENVEPQAAAKPQAACPAAWKPGWQRLADRVGIPVYCPSWMPSPIDAEIGGQWNSGGVAFGGDKSYLAGFLWHEAGSGDVHVNFRGYPGKTAVPRCIDTQTSGARPAAAPCRASATRRVRGRSETRR